MYTWNFNNYKKERMRLTSDQFQEKYPNVVSIAGGCPDWYNGRQYKKLAPKYWFWKKWHDGEFSNADYIKYYYEEVLNKLDPVQVMKDLGEDAIMLCHEDYVKDKDGKIKFCHRHIVADWFNRTIGINVTEMSV